ncbi:MAG: hypothetical protein RLZZ561_737 [Pseudomonadota bacterium]|jgi:hypothetical protein
MKLDLSGIKIIQDAQIALPPLMWPSRDYSGIWLDGHVNHGEA